MAVPNVVHLSRANTTAAVRRKLGEGGQGAVYAVDRTDGTALALKWYDVTGATERQSQYLRDQRRALTDLVYRPAPSGQFLWPEDLAVVPPHLVADHNEACFGYVMPLRPPDFELLSALYRRSDPVVVPLRVLCTIGMELADAYLRLHSQGLCYRDISPNNVFIRPATGEVLICDNDNVGIDGVGTSAIRGTRLYMAPEIVRREAKPTAATDLHSLAVLLFFLLMAGHPLTGRRRADFPCHNSHAESELFGTSPVFVFDPSDPSNRPQPGIDDSTLGNWEFFPESIRRLFVQAFTSGLHDPQGGRVRESVWRAELARTRDLIAICERCRSRLFFDPDGPTRCWKCHATVDPPLRLVLGATTVVLNDDTRLSRHHLHHDYDFDTTVAEITRHDQRPGVWGLRNHSQASWSVRLPDGRQIDVEPGRAIGLVPGLELELETGRVAQLCYR